MSTKQEKEIAVAVERSYVTEWPGTIGESLC